MSIAYGGALVIMGLHTRSESLFYYFRIEGHIPEDHLLRLIDRHVDFAFVRELSVDSTQLTAIAGHDRAVTRDQLAEVAKVNPTVREYVEQVERENVFVERTQTSDPATGEKEEPKLSRISRNSLPTKISITDPDAALSSKRGASELAYYDNYLIDNQSCIITGVMATPARLSQEIALHTIGASANTDVPVRFLAFIVAPKGSPLTLPA